AIFLSAEGAPQGRIDAQNLKEASGDHLSMQTFRLTIAREAETSAAVGSHPGKSSIHAAPVLKIRIRDGAVVKVRDLLKHGDKLVRMMKWQRIQQHAVDH